MRIVRRPTQILILIRIATASSYWHCICGSDIECSFCNEAGIKANIGKRAIA